MTLLVCPQTPPANVFRKVDRDPYDSLPRHQTNSSSSGGGGGGSVNNNNGPSPSFSPSPYSSSSTSANKRGFGKHFQLPTALRANSKRCSSAPNLGDGSQGEC